MSVTRRADISPENAILREARLGNHDVILLGVSRRPGGRLSFGELAAALLETSDRSLIFFAPHGLSKSIPAARSAIPADSKYQKKAG